MNKVLISTTAAERALSRLLSCAGKVAMWIFVFAALSGQLGKINELAAVELQP